VFASGRSLIDEVDRRLASVSGHGSGRPNEEAAELESAEGLESVGGADTAESFR
jgi:hypothetical protein